MERGLWLVNVHLFCSCIFCSLILLPSFSLICFSIVFFYLTADCTLPPTPFTTFVYSLSTCLTFSAIFSAWPNCLSVVFHSAFHSFTFVWQIKVRYIYVCVPLGGKKAGNIINAIISLLCVQRTFINHSNVKLFLRCRGNHKTEHILTLFTVVGAWSLAAVSYLCEL